MEFHQLRYVCAIADTGNFSRAAERCQIAQPSLSQQVLKLEEELGAKLFDRLGRSIRLTEGGKSYFEQSRAALNQLIEAERKVAGEQIQPSGTLRISAPTTYGHHRLLPLLPLFRAKYPKIKLEVRIGNRNIDFHVENFDLAIRFRSPPDSTLIAQYSVLTAAQPPSALRDRCAAWKPGLSEPAPMQCGT